MDKRLIIFATHPIQYQVPIYQKLSKEISLLVVYSLKQDAKGQANAGFGVQFEWDVPLREGYEYTYLENLSRNPSSSTYRGIVINPKEVQRLVQHFNPTHALINGWFPKALQQIKKELRKHPSIHIMCRGDSTLLMTQNPLKRLFKRVYIPWVLKGVDTFLFVGKANKAFYKFYGISEEKLKPAHHCINTPFFEKREGTQKHEIKKSVFRIGFVGKLTEIKNPVILLEAVAQCESRKKIVLKIIGSGPLKAAMEKRAKELGIAIEFLGFMNQQQLAKEAYEQLDCLVLPSKSETWGLVVNEAMTQGVPCIVSDRVGCHPDLINHGETGWVFQAEEPIELANVIDNAYSKLIADNQGESMSQAVLQRISKYSLSQTTQQILSALDTVH